MNDAILKAIKDSLPSLQAKELESLFAKYTENETKLASLEKDKERLLKENDKLKTRDKEFNDFNLEKEKLKKESEELKANQLNFKVNELTYKLEQEIKSNDKVFRLVETIFKNRVLNKAISGGTNLANGIYQPYNSFESITSTELI